jgi:hypothetical protein
VWRENLSILCISHTLTKSSITETFTFNSFSIELLFVESQDQSESPQIGHGTDDCNGQGDHFAVEELVAIG